jgi:replicative DNA helicase
MQTKRENRKPPIDLSTMVFGKVPPQAREIEIAVLGAIMLERDAFDIALEILKPESFYVDAHQRIYRAMVEMNQKNIPIDIRTVVEQLSSMGELENIGGPYYVTQLTSSVVSGANVESHSRIIKQKFLAREMIRISGEVLTSAYESTTDVFELMEQHEKQFTELATGGIAKSYVTMDVALMESINRIEALRLKNEHITGVPSGFADLDRITHGWQPTDLIILAARPAVGKTALALQIARNGALNALKPVPVAFFSLEMSTLQLTNRNISAESGMYLDNIQNGNLDDGQMATLYAKAIQKLVNAKFFIDDTAALSIFELRARCRRLKRLWLRQFGTDDGLIVVDYLQLMSGTGKKGNREQEISEISRGLKQIAKELHLPVIALSQLSRATEQRAGEKKMPQLSDLRESGAIEQDADMVMFLYRPEYYGEQSSEMGESTKGETHVKIAKHRNGSLDTIKLRANLGIQKFFDWDGNGFPQIAPTSTWRPVSLPYADDNKEEITF